MKIIVLFLSHLFVLFAFSQQPVFFNSAAPADTPQLFAPGIVNNEFGNRDMAIAPDGDEIFYTLQFMGGRGFSTIMHSVKQKGKWQKPSVAGFCGVYDDLEPAFSPDGKRLFFVSNRPLPGSGGNKKDFDIWWVEKQNNGWGQPVNMGVPVNSPKDEFYPSVTRSGNLYFTRTMGGAGEDIVVCHYAGNHYDTAISLPATINTAGAEFNAFVDATEQFVIFTGFNRKGNFGSGDLFISFKKEGSWTEAKNLGAAVNGAGLTYCPYVSPDKKYFFFASARGNLTTPFKKRQNVDVLERLMHGVLNGYDNIYWMNAKRILEDK